MNKQKMSSAVSTAPPYGQLSVSGPNSRDPTVRMCNSEACLCFGVNGLASTTLQALFKPSMLMERQLVRAAMGVGETGGYLTDPTGQTNLVNTVVKAAIDQECHYLGTPTWSQDVDVASQSPITGQSNLMYTLHYYAGSHKADLRTKAQTAINNGLPIFVTEYGTVNANGDGGVDSSSSNEWWDFLNQNSISHANWAVEDKNEGAAALVAGTPGTLAGVSSDSNLTPSGQLVKSVLKAASSGVSCTGSIASSSLAMVDGFQVDFVFTNSDIKSVCSATFTFALKSGQSLVDIWNMEASSNQQYKLPSWVNIGVCSSFKDAGISIKEPTALCLLSVCSLLHIAR
uniref:Endoglucanase n=1 Tax=Ditylenchus dipsaci TaxID=166011 RepID=A0A915EIN3_9BILA